MRFPNLFFIGTCHGAERAAKRFLLHHGFLEGDADRLIKSAKQSGGIANTHIKGRTVLLRGRQFWLGVLIFGDESLVEDVLEDWRGEDAKAELFHLDQAMLETRH